MIECPQPRLLGGFRRWGEWRRQYSRLAVSHGTDSCCQGALRCYQTDDASDGHRIAPAEEPVKGLAKGLRFCQTAGVFTWSAVLPGGNVLGQLVSFLHAVMRQ